MRRGRSLADVSIGETPSTKPASPPWRRSAPTATAVATTTTATAAAEATRASASTGVPASVDGWTSASAGEASAAEAAPAHRRHGRGARGHARST